MKIVFFGTPDFSVGCLRRMAAEHEILAVVTQPDRPRNRGRITFSPVKEAAIRLGLPVLQPEKIRCETNTIIALGAELGITAAYGQILPQSLLDAFPHGIVNVHASLLPKYRGSSPIQWAIINGEQLTGVTIMQTALGVDCGDILASVAVPVGKDETAGELFDRLAAVAPDLLSKTVKKIGDGTVSRIRQDEAQATHFPMLTKETGRIDFFQSAERVRNLIRGLDPWPGAFCTVRGVPLKLFRAETTEDSGDPGTVLFADERSGLVVACGEGALKLGFVQAPGGKKMKAVDYLRGHDIPVGMKLC